MDASDTQDAKQDKEEQKYRVAGMQPAGAHLIYETIKHEGEGELIRPASALAFSALAGGLSMGLIFATETALSHRLPHTDWATLITKLGYTVGFILVILGKQHLYTENTITPIIPLLDKKSGVTVGPVARLWGIVLAANMIAVLLFALALAYLSIFDFTYHDTMRELSIKAYHEGSVGPIFVRAIFAGWIVALMAWMMPANEPARMWLVAGLAYVVGIAEWPHIIAGATPLFYGAATGVLPWGGVLANWMLPTLIGNTIGGVVLTAALNYAQVTAGEEGDY